MCMGVYTYVCMGVYTYVCMGVYMYVCMGVYICTVHRGLMGTKGMDFV